MMKIANNTGKLALRAEKKYAKYVFVMSVHVANANAEIY